MPIWNLQKDYRPKGGKQFSMPIGKLNIPLHKYKLKVEVQQQPNKCISKGFKKLIIDVEIGKDVEVLAMAPGKLSSTGGCITLETEAFFNAGVIAFNSRYRKDASSIPFAWFGNWMKADLIPGKIIYENVVIGKKTSGNVHAGEVIGTIDIDRDLANPAIKRLILSIAYAGPIKGKWDGMHPREFFSLLFWKEDHDPILKQNPTDYGHELLIRMMGTDEDGKIGSTTAFINAPKDNWLGIRPPLRTFQRVKWEHIKEHLRNDYLGKWTGSAGNVKDRIMNSFIHKVSYKTIAKCNIYTCELLYRAGFRTPVWATGIGPKGTSYRQNRLKYLSPAGIRKAVKNRKFGIYKGKIDYVSTKPWHTDLKKATHEITTAFGEKATCNVVSINKSISKDGEVFIYATNKHVCTIYKMKACSSDIKIDGMHQWSISDPIRNNYYENYDKEQQKVTIVKALPGGDPSEEWGMLKSNCLITVSKGP